MFFRELVDQEDGVLKNVNILTLKGLGELSHTEQETLHLHPKRLIQFFIRPFVDEFRELPIEELVDSLRATTPTNVLDELPKVPPHFKEVIKVFIGSFFLIEVRKNINVWLHYIHNGLKKPDDYWLEVSELFLPESFILNLPYSAKELLPEGDLLP